MRFLIVLLLLGCIVSTAAGYTYDVDPRHPRILLYADSLAAIRARCLNGGPLASLYQAWFTTYETRLTNPTVLYIDDWALIYAISGDTRFSAKAIEMTMAQVRTNGVGQGGNWRLDQAVLTYDWCYDQFSQAQKDSVVTWALARLSMSLPSAYYRAQDLRWQYALAIHGEAGAQNGLVASKLEESLTLQEQHVLPCLDEIAAGGSSGYYPGVYYGMQAMLVDCMKHSIGYSGPALSSAWFAASPTHWRHRIRPDWQWARTTGRYNMSEAPLFGYLAYFGNRMADPYCQYLANARVALEGSGSSGFLPVMLWYDPSRPATAPPAADLTFADEEYGYYFWRSGWNLGAGSNDLQLSFFNGPDVEPDHEWTQNHLSVTRGNDDLLISAGKFFDNSDQHYYAYARQTASRNAAMIYDASESFGVNRINDGGQNDSDFSRSATLWPSCGANSIGWRGDGQLLTIAADVAAFAVTGNADDAYSSSKASRVRRDVVTLADREAWTLVLDDIALAGTYPAWISWHTIDRPRINAALTQVAGSDYGGIWDATAATRIGVRRGDSGARVYPRAVLGGPATTRLVGGASPANLIWRQSVRSSATLTYVADPAEQAFECWSYDGFNRSPTHSVSQSQLNERNVEPHSTGDWRVEIRVDGAVSPVFATLIKAAAIGDSSETMTWQANDSLAVALIGDGADAFAIVALPSWHPGGPIAVTIPGAAADCDVYVLFGLAPSTLYNIYDDGDLVEAVASDATGSLRTTASSGVLAITEGDPPPSGACCALDGSCTVTVEAECAGTWQGDDPDCDPNPCEQPTGACCSPDGSCQVTLAGGCAGDWTMFGICVPNPCPQPPAEADRRHSRRVVRRWIEEGR